MDNKDNLLLANISLQEEKDIQSIRDEFLKLRTKPMEFAITLLVFIVGFPVLSYFISVKFDFATQAMLLFVAVISLIFNESRRVNRRLDILFKLIERKLN
ncbi:MAG: hypothetical protein KF752_02910 [Pirellulaceae bacterium]|nr:hypothetical protein [Pirellulaceae bacterium]